MPKRDDEEDLESDRVNVVPAGSGDALITERSLLNLPPRAAPPAQPERKFVEVWRADKFSFVAFNGDDEPLSLEKARQDAAGAAGTKKTAAQPAKKPCKNCEKNKKKAEAKASGGGGEPTPAPDTTPTPTPAARGIPDSSSPEPEAATTQTTDMEPDSAEKPADTD